MATLNVYGEIVQKVRMPEQELWVSRHEFYKIWQCSMDCQSLTQHFNEEKWYREVEKILGRHVTDNLLFNQTSLVIKSPEEILDHGRFHPVHRLLPWRRNV